MQVQLWGVRGSLGSGCSSSMRYGCNTSCYTVEAPQSPYIILDAGSGIRAFGSAIAKAPRVKKCVIFLTHGHWDHVAGLPFFEPLYLNDWDITIYAPEAIGALEPQAFVQRLFNTSFFPVPWERLNSKPKILPLHEGQVVAVEGGVHVSAHKASHGGHETQGLFAAAYRVEHEGHAVFYSGDHELGENPQELDLSSSFFTGLRHADVAILDAQYTLENYKKHVGWGHSAMEQWPPILRKLGVKTFVPTHYAPSSSDAMLDTMCSKLLVQFPELETSMRMAYEGLIFTFPQASSHVNDCAPGACNCENCTFSTELSHTPDLSSVLDSLLMRARQLSKADAGTIYLVEDDELVFSYSHNDTLFTHSQAARQQYLTARLPMTPHSIAGYVACHGTVLNIPNVRCIPEGMPYAFNDSFDKKTGYSTVSICALPLFSQKKKLLGVMQIINCMHENEPVPFSFSMESALREICFIGAQAIEQSLVTKDMLLRILETARLRDPDETGPHVVRVGAMAAELYHHWAEKNGVDIVEIASIKASLRLASMLHDVGKVGISDRILKKPGAFTDEERKIMQTHCAIGAAIFKDVTRTLDRLSASIALHHHQRWDGTGYTGDDAPPLSGKDIPFEARITSIVDVFDALVSERCYKPPLPFEEAVRIIQRDAGAAFDPEMVQCFMEILDTIQAIQEKYQEEPA